MNRVNFKNINTKSVDQSYFKPKVNLKVKKEENKVVKEKPKYNKFDKWWDEINITGPTEDFTWPIKANNNNVHLEENSDKLEIITKVEKPKGEIIKTFINNKDRKYNDRGYHGWQSHCEYNLDGCKIRITDNVGGCGVQQLYGWGDTYNNKNISKLLDYILNDLHYGTSIILCQVGSKYYNTLFCKKIEDLGFKYYEEYQNNYHIFGKDTGRIYSLIINKK